MTIQFICPANRQGRLMTDPEDSAGNDVVLDAGAFAVTVVSGVGTFEYNAATNGLVFRRDPLAADGEVTLFHIDVDGQPGEGESVLPIDVEMTTGPAVPEPAVVVNESIALEAAGLPA